MEISLREKNMFLQHFKTITYAEILAIYGFLKCLISWLPNPSIISHCALRGLVSLLLLTQHFVWTPSCSIMARISWEHCNVPNSHRPRSVPVNWPAIAKHNYSHAIYPNIATNFPTVHLVTVRQKLLFLGFTEW